MIGDIDETALSFITDSEDLNEEGHKKGCRCVDCMGDFSGGEDE